MKNKSILGWTIIVIISLIPVAMLFLFGPGLETLLTGEIYHLMGQVTGLIGMTFFALTFILSTRNKFIEDLFGGLDKVYIAHRVLGSLALIMIMLHPILLVFRLVPSDLKQAAIYLLPTTFWSVNMGIIALFGLLILIFTTFYIKMKYQYWKLSHKFLGVVFIFAILHIFLIRNSGAKDYIFAGYYIYATIISIIGLSGFFYTLILKSKFAKHANYTITNITTKKDYYAITLEPENKPLEYKSGQFAFLTFINKKLPKEPHPFSIASKSNNKTLKVVIKQLGDYTSQLGNIEVGNRVIVEGPYGRFNFKEKNNDQVWIAGGVGITPFIGMAKDLHTEMKNKVDLYYTVKTKDEFLSLNLFKEVEHLTNKKFRLIPWVTEEKGFITLSDIQKNTPNLKQKDFYLCGPEALKESIKTNLTKLGVSKKQIFEEEFNFK